MVLNTFLLIFSCIFVLLLDVKGYSFKIGRDDDICQILLNQENIDERVLERISRVHFELTREKEDFMKSPVCITDLSRNGTWINGILLGNGKKKILQNKDRISVFDVKFILFEYRDLCPSPYKNLLPACITTSYFIQDKLGSGAFGEVFKALSIYDIQKFAIKHVELNLNESNRNEMDQIKAESLNEAKIMRSLSHPCIVRLMDIKCTEPTSTSLIMEFMPGGDLLQRILTADGGFLPEDETQCIIYQIILAIEYLHSKRISHRDIKPENVLMLSKDKYTIAKLTDFGLSKFVSKGTALKSLTGTPNYVAPEVLQCKQLGVYSELIDVWSTGVLLFACLSGSLPFADEYKGSIQDQIIKGVYGFYSERWKNVSREAIRLIIKMLKKDVNERIKIPNILASEWLSPKLPIIEKTIALIEQERQRTSSMQVCHFEQLVIDNNENDEAPQRKRIKLG